MLSTRVYLSFAVYKLAKFSSNPGKVHFYGLVHIFRYIQENKTLVLKYYADMNDALVSDLLRQASIKTENQLMTFSDSSWQDFPDTGRITGGFIIFYQCGNIYHGTHVTGPVDQSSAESDYNTACTAGMALAHFRILIREFLNKDTGIVPENIVPEETPIIVLDIKSAVCMDNNCKDTKHTRHISRRVHFVSNGENWKMHNIDWCERGMQFADIDTKNVVENDLNTILKYSMVIIYNWERTLVQEGWQNTGYYTEQEFCMTRLDLVEGSTQ